MSPAPRIEAEDKTLRETAVDLFGGRRVDAAWDADGRMRVRVRRLARRSRCRNGNTE